MDWLEQMRTSPRKKAMPILSFPAVQKLGITVAELISNKDRQAEGMKYVADHTDSAASVSMMDLSVEAECFGAEIRVSDDEVPTVVGKTITSHEDLDSLQIPKVGDGRTGLYIEACKKALELITDRPVFAGIIGPYTLAGRLMDVTEIMVRSWEDPQLVHRLLDIVTNFQIEYCQAYKEAGANGVVMAEPLAGLLSPDMSAEFHTPYVKRIVDAVQDENFIVIYHNCGNAVLRIVDTILATGAAAYHFGNAIDMEEMMQRIPPETIAMGNIDPAGQFRNGTPESIREATLSLLERCHRYPNFVISSGCDIPPMSKWENIDAFFAAVAEFYDRM